MLVCVFLSAFARETAGAARTRSSLRPHLFGPMNLQNSGALVSRGCGRTPPPIVMAGLVPAIHVLLYDRIKEVVPIRVCCDDGSDLPGTRPMLDVVLPLNGIADIIEALKVNKRFQSVLVGEALDNSRTMLEYSTNEIVGHADIKDAVSTVRQNVNPAACHTQMLLRRGWPGIGERKRRRPSDGYARP
jgi:hypothetical protein